MKPFNQWERELAEAIQPKGESAPIGFGSIPETGVTPKYVTPVAINLHHHDIHTGEKDPRGHVLYKGPSREEERLQKWEADLLWREKLPSDLISQLDGADVHRRPQPQESENMTATEVRHRQETTFGQDMTATESLRRHRELGVAPFAELASYLRANEQAGDDDEPTGHTGDGD